ncbi:MAG: cation:proton antiporter regulatory subunit [Mycobacteriales bacterium]
MSGDIQVEQTALPGIGVRHEFMTKRGRRVGVMEHRSGRRDLLLYDVEDPDSCSETVALTSEEADALAEFLGVLRIRERLAQLSAHVPYLVTEEILVPHDSPYAGKTLGATGARSRTGASIVAILRDDEAIPSPAPDSQLRGGDKLIVIGTHEGVAGVAGILNAG